MDRKLQRHRADSLRQHGFLVIKNVQQTYMISGWWFSTVTIFIVLAVWMKYVCTSEDHSGYRARVFYRPVSCSIKNVLRSWVILWTVLHRPQIISTMDCRFPPNCLHEHRLVCLLWDFDFFYWLLSSLIENAITDIVQNKIMVNGSRFYTALESASMSRSVRWSMYI